VKVSGGRSKKLKASSDGAKFVGVYEHLNDSNVFGEQEFGTHYVVLAYELNLDHQPLIVSDQQHSGFLFALDGPAVHQ
jgi:colanic acid biosynthesis protein WcaH